MIVMSWKLLSWLAGIAILAAITSWYALASRKQWRWKAVGLCGFALVSTLVLGVAFSREVRLLFSHEAGILFANLSPDRSPRNAVTGLDTYPGLACTLFASEPEVCNLTNLDIDHKGRIWACEVRNYRRHAGERPAGDRILVLEDKDGDGRCDQTTIFYQGRDIDSAHGICVLGDRIIVSALDKVLVFYDENEDLKADERREVLFTGIGGIQHDHGIHACAVGPDGKIYFSFGNEGMQILDKDGNPIIDQAGHEVKANRQPYQDGMVFRCDVDGSHFETIAWNFRNSWEVTVDSFGTPWVSDNDDDGGEAVRINYLMEFGNYGYKDEITGASWTSRRDNIEKELPRRHWHLNDPGVVPTMLITGSGAPTGICVYEGRLLPKVFWDQLIHCDAGPRICRAYVTTKNGAGYQSELTDILKGTRDTWFRPTDVCVAPDGSLFISDWYDPGVGGHDQRDVNRGRIFRIAPPGSAYSPPRYNFETADDCLEALQSPNTEARYRALNSLVSMGENSHQPLIDYISKTVNVRYVARALWILAKLSGGSHEAVRFAIKNENPDLRVTGVRIAREAKMDISEVASLVKDVAPEVRREIAISLHSSHSQNAAEIWSELATQFDGQDRWYLEALGIGADQKWDAFLALYLSKIKEPWKTLDGREILWRSRARQTPGLLVKILRDPATREDEQARYFRSLDFLSGPEKDAAISDVASSGSGTENKQGKVAMVVSALLRLPKADLSDKPEAKAELLKYLHTIPVGDEYLDIVQRFTLRETKDELLRLAIQNSDNTLGVRAVGLLLKFDEQDLIQKTIADPDLNQAVNLIGALGRLSDSKTNDVMIPLITDLQSPVSIRIAAVTALGRNAPGQRWLLDRVDQGDMPMDLRYVTGNVLLASSNESIRHAAGKHFRLPAVAGGEPIPPITSLIERKGNAKHGEELFFSIATCAACHKVNGKGKDVGPNLSEIGRKLSKEAMYVSVLDPNAGVSLNYETWLVIKQDGTTLSGILVSQTDNSIELKTIDSIVHKFDREEIESLEKLRTSLMPNDLQKLLRAQDLIDIVEYLATLKRAN